MSVTVSREEVREEALRRIKRKLLEWHREGDIVKLSRLERHVGSYRLQQLLKEAREEEQAP